MVRDTSAVLRCNSALTGNLTADTRNCLASCLTSDEVNLTVAGNTTLWSPSADMTSGQLLLQRPDASIP
eukprot:1594464-Amphidinium_carterae.2